MLFDERCEPVEAGVPMPLDRSVAVEGDVGPVTGDHEDRRAGDQRRGRDHDVRRGGAGCEAAGAVEDDLRAGAALEPGGESRAQEGRGQSDDDAPVPCSFHTIKVVMGRIEVIVGFGDFRLPGMEYGLYPIPGRRSRSRTA